MKKAKLKPQTEITVKGIKGFMIKRVTSFGTGAKVDCPKEYLKSKVYLIITDEKE